MIRVYIALFGLAFLGIEAFLIFYVLPIVHRSKWNQRLIEKEAKGIIAMLGGK